MYSPPRYVSSLFMSTIIVVANSKGGVGKTTTALNVAYGLADLGRRVLCVDLDPQASLTVSLGFDRDALSYTVYDLLLDSTASLAPGVVVLKTPTSGLDILPANARLTDALTQLADRIGRERTLSRMLGRIPGYDFVVVDTPPALNLLTTNALSAAHVVLIPVETDYLALDALTQFLATLHEIAQEVNPDAANYWFLPTKHDRTTEHARQMLAELERAFAERVLPFPVPYSVRAKESVATAESIFTYDPQSSVATAYRNVAIELSNHVRA
jgi:chromosome partitioning protein